MKFDQHFLENKNILKTTIECADIEENDIILEIGPGEGVLTKELLQTSANRIIGIEIDKSILKKLQKLEEKNKNFELIPGNAITIIETIKFNKLIANIPYSITEPLYEKILSLKVPLCVLLHGKYFYKRITDERSKWHYYVNAFYKVEELEEISGDNFEPKTKVKSSLIKLELTKFPSQKKLLIQKFFNKKDRTTLNTLIFSFVDTYNLSKRKAQDLIKKLNLDENTKNKKFKQLSNQEFVKLIKKIETLNL